MLFALLVLVMVSGCAHYEFDLSRPQELSRHVGDSREERFGLDPLEYRMQSAEGHLVIKVFNPTADTILLLGRLSSVVDPAGESHPLADQTVAPSSFVKLILPPLRPRLEPSGPRFGIGVGVIGFRSWPQRRYAGYRGTWVDDPAYDSHYDQPRYYSVYDANDPTYWDWEGETDIRLALVFRRGKDEFRHEFAFHRKRI